MFVEATQDYPCAGEGGCSTTNSVQYDIICASVTAVGTEADKTLAKCPAGWYVDTCHMVMENPQEYVDEGEVTKEFPTNDSCRVSTTGSSADKVYALVACVDVAPQGDDPQPPPPPLPAQGPAPALPPGER